MTTTNPYYRFFQVNSEEQLEIALFNAYNEMREVYSNNGCITLHVA